MNRNQSLRERAELNQVGERSGVTVSPANQYVESKLFVKQVGNGKYDISRYQDYRKVVVGYNVSLKEAVSYAQWNKLDILRLK